MLVFYLDVGCSGMYVSESVCKCYLYVRCIRDELSEVHLIKKISRIL